MFNWKYPLGILCALSLVATVPSAPAKAENGGAIAAGIVGAIVMSQIMQGGRISAGMRPQASRRRAAHPNRESSGKEAHAKDPFAGESTPAGYAKPVTESK